MRELNFSRENVAEAFEEIHENFEDVLEREIEGTTTEFLNGLLREIFLAGCSTRRTGEVR